MSEPYFEWRQNSPSELAQYVQLKLPKSLCWPKHISRFDLLTEKGPYELVEQLYTLLLKHRINYDMAPFEPRAGIIQQIRKPKTILDSSQGTCLDLVVLLAGMCLANELLPIIIAVDGHALLAVSLMNTRVTADQAVGMMAFDRGVLENLTVLQKWAEDDDQYVFLECTGVARSRRTLDPRFPDGQEGGAQGTMSFEEACQEGLNQILKFTGTKNNTLGVNQRAFLYALHIHDLQVKYGFSPVIDADEKIFGNRIDARGSQGFINNPQAPVTQVYGTQRNTNTGGDYAERDIYKGVAFPFAGSKTNVLNLNAAYERLLLVRRQFEPQDPDLAHDLGEVISLLDAAITARDKNNTSRYQTKLDQARSTLSGLSASQTDLRTIVQMLENIP
jgi:hypothetical protein